MNKTLTIVFALGLVSSGALAQGTINFGTTAAAHRVTDGVTGVGTGYQAALYWGGLGSPEANLIQLGAATGVVAGAGFLVAGGTRTTGVATAEGSDAAFQIRVWSGGAATYELALLNAGPGLLIGKTAVFTNPTGAPSASPPTTPAFLTGWNEPIVVYIPTPEPSSFALITLGLGAWAMHRSKFAGKMRY